jgi:hypothetical protein
MSTITQALKGKQLADFVWNKFETASTRGHKDYTKRAKYLENLYLGAGRHWDTETRETLNSQGKPVLEVDLVFSVIQSILGYQTQSRMNLAYQPRESGDQDVSEILSKIALYELDKNKFPWVESQVFSDGMIQQRGYYDIRMDYSEDLKGKIRIRSLDPLDVIPDPNGKSYDPKDWNIIQITKWMSINDIKTTYPNKWRQVMNSCQSEGDWGTEDTGEERNKFADSYTYSAYHHGANDEIYVRVIDSQYYKVVRRDYFYDGDTLTPVPDDMSKSQAKREAKRIGSEVITRVEKRIRWTVSTKDTILHDDWSPYDTYTIVPFFPVFRRGQTVGLVDNLASLQDSLDKMFSQANHIINTTANSGWIIEQGSLTNMDIEDLEQRGAETGLVVEHKRGYSPPKKIEPNKVPTGFVDFINRTVEFIKMVGIVSEAFQGQKSNEVSGQAIQQRVAQTAIGLSSMIDNLLYTRNLVGEKILNLIQNFYTEERVFRIISDRDTEKEQADDVIINQEVAVGEDEYGEVVTRIINDVQVGEYDVVISDVPTQVNYQQGQLQEAIELRKYGVTIPDDEMVKLSTLTRKNEIAKRISGENNEEQQAALAAQMEQMKAAIEELKSKSMENEASAMKKIADIAKMIAETPQTGVIMDTIQNEIKPKEQLSQESYPNQGTF